VAALQNVHMCVQAWTKKTVSKDDWEKKLAAVKIYKEDMNKLVMNFLVTEASQLQQSCAHGCRSFPTIMQRLPAGRVL